MSKNKSRRNAPTVETDSTADLSECSSTADILRHLKQLEDSLNEVKNGQRKLEHGQTKLEQKLEAVSSSMDSHYRQ